MPTSHQASVSAIESAEAAQTARRAAAGTAVVGLQWGDEGKGKIVDRLAESHDVVVRYNGGANAGHSVVVRGERFALHLIPSGVLHAGKPAVVGNGVVVDPEWLLKEIAGLAARGVDCKSLMVSDRAHVVMPWHKAEDELRERWLSASSGEPIGTTKRGIGPCYADKVQRGTAVRMGDLLRPDLLAQRLALTCPLKTAMLGALARGAPGGGEPPAYSVETMLEQCTSWGRALKPYIRDTSAYLMSQIDAGKRVLFEGANATLLDVDHGTYPFVTSSSTVVLGAPTGSGVPMSAVGRILGVMKAYSTRVGGGAMPTELIRTDADKALGERIRQRGREFGTTTGRPRRVGWLDLCALRYSARLNGVHGLCVMLMDVLADLPELSVCVGYDTGAGPADQFVPDGHWLAGAKPVYRTVPGFSGDLTRCRRLADLPAAARLYLEMIEKHTGVPIATVSVGPDREQTIDV